MIDCDVSPDTGAIQLSGSAPNGSTTIKRIAPGIPTQVIRSGTFTNAVGAWFREDLEAPVGIEVTHRVEVTVVNRVIQRNRVRTPRFNYGAQTWTAGSSRTLTASTDFGHVTANPGGTGAGTAGRTIAEVGISPLEASTQYLVTGEVRIHTPLLWTWQDVLDNGTWQDLKDDKNDWAEVRSSVPALAEDSVYTALYVSLATGSTVHVAPIKAIDVPMNRNNEWFTFAVYITTPATIPATAKLRLLHGTETREYAIDWDLNRFQIKNVPLGEALPTKPFYIDGDMVTPADSAAHLTGEDDWHALTSDADITWTGTPGNSESLYTGPSKIYTETKCTIEAPADAPCSPILLSDPTNGNLAIWAGLIETGSLLYAARAALLPVIKRADWFAHNDVRMTPRGTMSVMTETLQDRLQMLAVFERGRVLMLRNPDPQYPENNWYIMCMDLTESRVPGDSRLAQRFWEFQFYVVARPTGLIEASGGTDWSEIAAHFTWAELKAARTDWLEVITEPVG